MSNFCLIAAQQEVVSIEKLVERIIAEIAIETFKSTKQTLGDLKHKLFEVLRKTQNSDEDDLFSLPISNIVKKIDQIICFGPTVKAERRTDVFHWN